MTKTHPSGELPDTRAQVCPHLAVQEDRQTCLGYPSPWNFCHKCSPAASVRMSHQRRMCLSPEHSDCPVYKREQAESLPAELRGRASHPDPSKPRRI